jgi:cytochrome b subunit of formate dehydrogenase
MAEKIERHASESRFMHWAHALFMFLLIITGYGIYDGFYLFSDYATNLSLHMIAAFGIIMVSIVLPIYFWIAKPAELKLSIIYPSDIGNFFTIVFNFLGITKKYPKYHVWNTGKREYAVKYHPAIKFIRWGDFFILILMAVTGLGLYYGQGTTLGFILNYWSLTLTRTIHLACFYYFIFSLMAHIYLALIPVNRSLLKSMIFGEDTGEDTVRV